MDSAILKSAASAEIDSRWLVVVVAVSGFASLGLEIVWFRLMLQFVIATTEAFTAMLATVLAGIAIGGLIASRILSRERDPVAALGIVQAVTGLAAVAQHDVSSCGRWSSGWNTMALWQAVTIAILPPSLFMGIGFPLALGIAGATDRRCAEAGASVLYR